MPNRVRRIVVFPRYTPFVGTTPVYSAPADVRDFSGGIFVGWQGTGLGLSPASVEFTLEVSQDLENWFASTVISPAANTEEAGDVEFPYAWMRWKAVPSGTDPGVTGWLVGDIVLREGAGEAGAA